VTDYLTVVEVLAIQADQIERYGGAKGVRDRGLLEAALYRPQTGYYADLIEEAAALWESLAQNHPFVDGNKRTAFAVTYTFLAINGGRVTADALPTHEFIMGLHEAGAFDFEPLTAWLRNNVSPE
jgi:death-on-curing protein